MISSFGNDLEYLFKDIIYIGFYSNPVECSLSLYVSYAKCSLCNSGTNHNSRGDCVSAGCGWCSYGSNCVEGTHQGPVNQYSCPEDQWNFETCT